MYVIDSAKGVVTNVSDQEYEMTSRYHQIEYNFNQITDDDYNSRLSQQEDDWYEFSYEDDGEYIEVIRFY